LDTTGRSQNEKKVDFFGGIPHSGQNLVLNAYFRHIISSCRAFLPTCLTPPFSSNTLSAGGKVPGSYLFPRRITRGVRLLEKLNAMFKSGQTLEAIDEVDSPLSI
jgi:hypothetical protein